jgi:TolA-binding protein
MRDDMRRGRRSATAAALGAATAIALGASQQAGEDVARRQLESGRIFLSQGKFTEALKDFRAVAETHSGTTVADNALLEIARYFLDVAGSAEEAPAPVEMILKKYPTSDSAPDAHLMVGRLALARGRSMSDLDGALANFDRVLTLFPNSDAVPRALVLSGQTQWYAGRLEQSLSNLSRVQVEYSASESAADAYLAAGLVLVSMGDPILAMEEMQQARNRWPSSPAAAAALSRIALLHRLYVRARGGPAYATAEPIGPQRLQDVVSMVATPRGAVYWAARAGTGALVPPTAEKPPAAQRPMFLTLDRFHRVFVVAEEQLRGAAGNPIALLRPRTEGEPQPLGEVEGAVQLSTGDWLVADRDTRAVHKYSPTGEYTGIWTEARLSRLAVTAVDRVAGLDRDEKAIVFFNATGKEIDRLPLRGANYRFENPIDLTFDVFGHLFVLDREAVAVFTPHPPGPGAAPAPAAAAAPARGAPPPSAYRLLTTYADPGEKTPTGFRRATAFAVDPSGVLYLADDRLQRIRVYR